MNINEIKGIIFDYGGTIDSNGTHWAEVIWDAYTKENVPVSKAVFRDAYVYAERYLATHYVIFPEDTFRELLQKKMDLQFDWLFEHNFLEKNEKTSGYSLAVSNQCYNFANSTLQNARPILQKLAGKYPMVLVSNFYGNVRSVLEDFGICGYFNEIIESAVVGIRKPDPAIFALGVEKLGFLPENIVVIGDSYTKDIVPATQIGCKTIWLKGPGWEEEDESHTAGRIIDDFSELQALFNL